MLTDYAHSIVELLARYMLHRNDHQLNILNKLDRNQPSPLSGKRRQVFGNYSKR